MEKKTKRISSISKEMSFEETDHRLACGWHVNIEGSGQRKRYLKSLKLENSKSKKDKLIT